MADKSIYIKRFLGSLAAAALLAASAFILPAQAHSRHHRHRHHYFNHHIERRLPDRFSYIVIEATTGYVLGTHHADKELYPASLSKLMTLYLTFDALDDGRLRLGDYVPVSRLAASQVPSKIGVVAGTHIRVEDCIRAITTHSANDCAMVLAQAVGGTEKHFARMMTDEARKLGMRHSHFVNPTGLFSKEQYSSARDMATLARALIRNHPDDYHYFSLPSFTYGGETFPNHDELLALYPGMDGLKTGYVYASGYNLASSAVHNGTRLIGVIFGGRTIKSRNREMVHLLNQGFTRVRHIRLTRLLNAEDTQKLILPSQRPFDMPDSGTEIKAGPEEDSNIPAPVPQLKSGKEEEESSAAGNKTRGGWAIQIGSFYSHSTGEQALQVAQSALHGVVDGVSSIAPLVTPRGIVYRARLSGLDRHGAAAACRVLKSNCLILAQE